MGEQLPVDRPISWAPKVEPERIKRLYHRYAALGIVDEEQIDDVGFALYARCRAIWCVSECRCPECETPLESGRAGKYAIFQCPGCGWCVRKRRFRSSHKRKRLVGGSAYPAFLRFLEDFKRARNPDRKMLAIDRLIHAFHGDYEGTRARLRRTACQSVVSGSDAELGKMLHDLAYEDNVPSEMRTIRVEWRKKLAETRTAQDDHVARQGE